MISESKGCNVGDAAGLLLEDEIKFGLLSFRLGEFNPVSLSLPVMFSLLPILATLLLELSIGW